MDFFKIKIDSLTIETITMRIRFDRIRINMVDLPNKWKGWKIVVKIMNSSILFKGNYIDWNKFWIIKDNSLAKKDSFWMRKLMK